MATSILTNNVPDKKECPYMEKCYRRNPIHFNEMSHPHLERIVLNQLEGEILIPEKLDFDCPDRSLLVDQLKILQMVLRKQKGVNAACSSNKDCSSNERDAGSSTKKACKVDKDSLKDKVEKHKQLVVQKRENKLKEMDQEAESLYKSSNEIVQEEKVNKMKKELDSLKIIEESIEKSCSSQDRKRNSKTFGEEAEIHKEMFKRSKSNEDEDDDEVRECSPPVSKSLESVQSTSGSSKGTSLIEDFESSKSAKSRREVRDKAIRTMRQRGFNISVVEPGNFAMKHALSAPYHLFFSRIENEKSTHNQQLFITFPEILDISLGEIVCSLQINFMVDIGWLCLQYLLAGQRTDMTIVYGERVDTEKPGPNITTVPIGMPKFGCHHSKVMILKYKDDGIRVIVSTANLYSDDWENRMQGVWISPHLPPLAESANSRDGESPTEFKKDLERYLNKYRQRALTEWVTIVRRADFSSVNVFFLASVPGSHKDVEENFWGYRKLGYVLSKHAKLPPDAPQWTLVAQCSSIGSLGPNYESWIEKEITSSMSKENPSSLKSYPKFQFIYPTISNYKHSFDGRVGSCCLPYSMQRHSSQEWIESYMCQWKASRIASDKAMPHIKTYARYSPDFKKIPWFVLTSANLSKAAWGKAVKNGHYIMNYEVGVVFIPKFITGSTTFPIKEEEIGIPVFPIPYDLPPTRYENGDKPFVVDIFND